MSANMKENFLEMYGYKDEGWSVENGDILQCPCGRFVEDDGQCPNGHVSPLLEEGII